MILDQPDAIFLDRTTIGPIAGWVLGAPQYMKRVGWDEFLKRPIGTGPYRVEGKVEDYRKMLEGGIYATLVANPDYWKEGFPKIQRVTFVHHSSKKALQALLDGSVDLVTSLIPKDTLKVEESSYSKVVKGRNDIRWTVTYFNLMSPNTFSLRNLLVRRALNYAVNKDELGKYAYKGNAVEMRGLLTEKSGVDLSDTKTYEWNVEKARELLKEAGYENGLKMRLFYQEKDFLLARLLQRFFSLLEIEVAITPENWEWFVEHMVYPNTRTHEGYSWDNEDWWLAIFSNPSYVPEIMGGLFEWVFHSGAPWQTCPNWIMLPLDRMYDEVLRTTDRDRRFQIYKKANEYIASQALQLFTVAPLTLYGVNEELNFVPQVSQYLYLDYSSVTENHWSIKKGQN
jgi:peptide/nickel transport system substrate-binding protein